MPLPIQPLLHPSFSIFDISITDIREQSNHTSLQRPLKGSSCAFTQSAAEQQRFAGKYCCKSIIELLSVTATRAIYAFSSENKMLLQNSLIKYVASL